MCPCLFRLSINFIILLEMKISKYLFAGLVLLISCEKGEIAVPAHDSGDVLENSVAMEQDYRNQLFFDLETNSVVSSNLKTDWDIAFESSPTGFHVTLNTSKGMAVHCSELDFVDITSADDLVWTWDAHSGNLDSTGVGNWLEEEKLYVVDRGYNYVGSHLGYAKLKFVSVNESTYEIQFASIEESIPLTSTITKSLECHMTYYSFESGLATIAPPDFEWDLMFTQYTHLFSDPISSYVVSGVLLNRHETSAIIISDKNFQEVKFEDVADLDLKTELNSIGYKWKWYDFDAGLYLVNSDICYIIRTSSGFYYKLRFLDFYNESGEKGYPRFEFQQL